METKRVFLGLDVGERRIGVAVGDSIGRISQPVRTILNDEQTLDNIKKFVIEFGITDFVLGRPRNQSGDKTAQTSKVEEFAHDVLQELELNLIWQDESVTSVIAEERLKNRGRPYQKSDIDAEAAAIILQDYLDTL